MFNFSEENHKLIKNPGVTKAEGTKALSKFNRLCQNRGKCIIIAHLDVTSQREILTQRVSPKAIVRKYTAQIWMKDKGNAIEISNFPLESASIRVKSPYGKNQARRKQLRKKTEISLVAHKGISHLKAQRGGRIICDDKVSQRTHAYQAAIV